ncbi:mitogen-activated protein kinase kinase kinase 1-like [Penaeus japonicus]|uniref:mitogen-activated protein kinase kinase kinase 1-like n=1 Tax=Penaeus japonicus TaxID=27405 RepID=UPI001C714831|nr:mitogen-activated protein kinase kinase kinase 1-like [Penaeus japonicus]
MSAHAANSRLAASFSVQTHTSARSPLVETGDAAENSGFSGKRDGSAIGPRDPLASAPCSGGRTSAPPCSATTANSAKSLSPSSAASASDYTVSKNGHAGAVSAHHGSASSDSNAITSSKSKDANSSECSSGGVSVFASARSHNLSSLGERSSPASVRRSDGGRESRMDTANFRLRLRKGGGEGVTKKGPLVAKHPSTSTVSNPTSSSAAKEVRSPVGPGPPPLGSHRRRPVSPDPRGHARTRATATASRDSPRSSPRTSPRSSPKSSPVRQLHRERSMSPGARRYVGRGSMGVSSRTHSSRVTPTPPSPPSKRATPPTSPRVRRQRSPSSGGAGRRNPSPGAAKLADAANAASAAKSARARRSGSPGAARAPSRPPSPNTPGAVGGTASSGAVASRRPPSPTTTSANAAASATGGARPPSPGARRPPSPRGTSPRGRGASPGSRGPPISEETLRARVRRALRARLYLLHQPGPNSFTVGGDSPTHKYKVIIGPQTCSCGHGPYCVHVLFVMVRVLQVAEADPVLLAGSLKDFEIEQLMRAYEERLKKAVRSREQRQGGGAGGSGTQSPGGQGGRSSPSTPTGTPSPHLDSAASDEESQCPICLMCMVEGESLVMCESGCRNLLHHHCMAVWAADRNAQGHPLLCPLCRAPWPLKHHPRLTPTPGSTPVTRPHLSTSPPVGRTPPLAPDYAYPLMSASFSGVCSSGRQSPLGSGLMSRSLSSAYPHTHSPYADSAYSSPAGGSGSGVLGSAYPPTVRGEVSAAIAASTSEEAVPLPRSEPIPAEHESTAASWVQVFGKELVACLFSRDWAVRETGLRRLAHEVVKVLHWDRLVTGEDKRRQVIHCCANILAQVANDPVYKVYLACLRCVRVLLSHLSPSAGSEVTSLQELFRPLVHTLLLKCADGNRRTSQISVDSILELCRGQEGELALGTQVQGTTPGLGGISYVLSCILDDSPPSEAPWQWLLGRLCVLDRLVDEFPSEFQLQYLPLQSSESGYKLQHYDRLMTVVEFAFKALGSSHATVSKLARRVYICGARFAAAEPAVFHQVCDMLAKLDVSLQMRLKRRLRSMQGQHSDRKASLARLEGKLSIGSWDLGDTAGPRLVRSVSHSPSRMLSALRSSSQSPARQSFMSSSKDAERASKGPAGPTSSPPRPTHLPLDCFESKFKEKQAKLRLYHKTRPKHDIPFVVQNVLVSPVQQQRLQRWSPVKMGGSLHKSGLSQSHGDALDVSPQTPVSSVAPPQFSFRDVVSTPATPTAPHCTPVRETAPSVNQSETNGLHGGDPWAAQEAPLPVIPGLDLLPAHLDDALHPYEQNVEGGQYEEGRDWVRGPLLGTGAFSSCYQARDVRTGTLMAVKQVSFCRNSEEEQERVEASVEEEILIMSRLRHTNIVRLLGASRHSTSFSVFTEWMAGGSVATMLDKYGTFSEHVILKYTKQVLAGLAYLHDNKILHRDLKGANLLVDSTGQWLRIGDFGTAARMASKSTVTGEFQGQLLGTIAFMAPEVLRGEDYGRSCDVWSVGCCVIEMATTKPPWGADYVSNQLKLMYKIATSNGPPTVPETLSAPTRDLALRCLEIKSENRPPAKELLQHPCFKTQPP